MDGMTSSVSIPVSELRQSLPEEADDLLLLADEAERFLMGHKWCRRVESMVFDRGFKHCALFLATIEPVGADPTLWVIVGDVPPAYIDTETCPTAVEALE